jgi:hypothetical protein
VGGIACGAVAAAVPAAGAAISVGAYRRALVAIQADLGRGDWAAARGRAGRLAGERIASGGGEELAPDLAVLRPLAGARDRGAAAAAAMRLSRLIEALPVEPAAPVGPAAAAAPVRAGPRAAGADPALLERLRRHQALAEIAAGGKLPDPGVEGGGVLAALWDFLQPARRAIAAAWQRFVRWLERWLESLVRGAVRRPAAFGLRGVVVLAVLLALAMLGLATQAMRRRQRRGKPAAAAAAAMPAPPEDDDPLSRAGGEWEAYARQLAAAGRCREAIRAWFHAVLVTLYQSGALQFRKGRTNWEYLAAVPPSTSWRPALVEMTRHFEREWYGRDRSSAEALLASEGLARQLLHAVRSSTR